jgi:hypothetical protein
MFAGFVTRNSTEKDLFFYLLSSDFATAISGWADENDLRLARLVWQLFLERAGRLQSDFPDHAPVICLA